MVPDVLTAEDEATKLHHVRNQLLSDTALHCRTEFAVSRLASRMHPRGTAGLQPTPPKPPIRNLKNAYFVGIMIAKVLHDIPFSQNHPLKSADD
jgi:hypothetical protein